MAAKFGTLIYAIRSEPSLRSFATVILTFEALLVQRGVDKPSTGGLSIYKLFCLLGP
jgi:hypothetical protein